MKTLAVIARLRWLIAIAVLAIALYVYTPVGCVIAGVLAFAAPMDYLMMVLPAKRRRDDQARRAQVAEEARRLIEES